MSQASGYNAYIGIGDESTYGTSVAATIFAEIESESLKGKRPLMPTKTLGTLSQRRTFKDKAEVGGSIRYPLVWNGLEKLLKQAFGASSSNITGTNPYTHTFTLKTPMVTGATIVVNRDAANLGTGTMWQYVGCHCSKFKLSQKIGEPLFIDQDWIGSNFSNVNIQAPTYPTFDPIEYGQMTICSLDATGSPYAMKVKEWSLEIDNKVEPIMRLTDFKSAGVFRTDHRLVTFETQIELENLTAYAYARDALTEDLSFKWVKDANTDLTLTVPKAFFPSEDPETSGPGPYYLNFKGQCLMNSADNDELTLALKNQTAGPD